ncbi:MAG TPA: PIN domain-containing protein [Bryobacteraceae bacterium]|jgi:predicted nucleic acid-binding protein
MVAPASGPFLFDTSAESWLARSRDPAVTAWFREYLSLHPVHVSAITIVERIRGYALVYRRAEKERQQGIEAARVTYLSELRQVWPIDSATAVVTGEIMALRPHRPHRGGEPISLLNPDRSAWFAGASTV